MNRIAASIAIAPGVRLAAVAHCITRSEVARSSDERSRHPDEQMVLGAEHDERDLLPGGISDRALEAIVQALPVVVIVDDVPRPVRTRRSYAGNSGSRVMAAKPGEHKTVQACILAYAQ